MNKTIKNIAIFTGILAVCVFAYVYWPEKVVDNSISSSLSSNKDISENQKTANFIASLSGLKTLTIDPELFTIPSFKSLEDNTVEITVIGVGDIGRINPFAPVAGSSQNVDSMQNDNSGFTPLLQNMN